MPMRQTPEQLAGSGGGGGGSVIDGGTGGFTYQTLFEAQKGVRELRSFSDGSTNINNPTDVLYVPGNPGKVYVSMADLASPGVAVFDPVTFQHITTITDPALAGAPSKLVHAPNSGLIYVGNPSQAVKGVAVIDPSVDAVVAFIGVTEQQLSGVYDHASGKVLMFTFTFGGTVEVIDPLTNTLLNSVVVAGGPAYGTYVPSTQKTLVALNGAGTVDWFDAVTETFDGAPVAVGAIPQQPCYMASKERVFVPSPPNGVRVMTTASPPVLESTVAGSTFFGGLTVNPVNDLIYAQNLLSPSLQVVHPYAGPTAQGEAATYPISASTGSGRMGFCPETGRMLATTDNADLILEIT